MEKTTMRRAWIVAVGLALIGAAPTIYDISAHGLPCQGNCSGEPAGYAFARRHQVVQETQCRGYSDAFWRGCVAYGKKKTG